MGGERKNISSVVEDGLCCGCGVCSLVCPVGCISMTEDACGFIVPTVDQSACVHCGRCWGACPMVSARAWLTEMPMASYPEGARRLDDDVSAG